MKRSAIPSRPSILLVLLVMSMALASLACGAPHMRFGSLAPITPDPAAATVVFIRASVIGATVTPVIATAAGKFLGESEANRYFVAKLPPGEHLLVSWSESTPAMKATLAAGRIYYVEVAPRIGFGSARVQLLALGPRRPQWPEVQRWLAECAPIEADELAGDAFMRAHANAFAERVGAAQASYQGYSREDREARTLLPEDGVAEPFGRPGFAMPPGAPVGPVAPVVPGAPIAVAPGAAPAPAPASPPPARPAGAAGGIDSVFLKNGARYRGVVMEEEPTRVSIKLVDGTTKVLRRSEVDRVEYGQ